MKTQQYLLLILLAIIVAVNVNGASISQANCDQIIQCDDYGPTFDGSGDLICNNAGQSSPDTEEVFITSIRISDFCDVGDTSTDCISPALNYYEELNDNNVYLGFSYNWMGGVTVCCTFGQNTVYKFGLVNDFNSDRENPISREWSIVDSSDTKYDSCPTTTYDPQDISQTTDLSTFNISFKPFANNYDQWTESSFGAGVMWNMEDYYLQNKSQLRSYYYSILEDIWDISGKPSFDLYNVTGTFLVGSQMDNYFDDYSTYFKDSCDATAVYCTTPGSTSTGCTAGTGVNVLDDTEGFLNAFFNKYKVPIMMRLGHEWCSGDTLSDCGTGYYYWENAYGINGNDVLTYQGMRQYTTRDISRIESDWAINSFSGTYVICDQDANIRVVMVEETPLGTTSYDIDPNLNKYDLIKGETYTWGVYNDEDDVVTSDSLFRFDWTNDGTWEVNWDDQVETEGLLASNIDTSSATSDLNMDAETWGKGGKDSTLTPYRIYENPVIIFDRDEGLSAILGSSVTFTPFDGSFYDIGDIDWFCYDITNDGIYDYVFRKSGSTSYNCTTDGSTIISTDSNLYNNFININSAEVSNIAGTYTLRIKGGQNLVNRANYTTYEDIDYSFNVPNLNADITLKSSSWNTFAGDTINFNLEDSTVDTDIEAVCYDEDYTDSNWDYCLSQDGTGYCGLGSCILDSTPETNIFNIDFIDVGDYVNHQIKARIIETYGYTDEDTQIYSFRLPVVSANFNWLSDYKDIKKTLNITFNTVGSTSENPIYSICMDIDNDGSDEQCENSTSATFTIEYSDINDYDTHDVALTIIDDQGYSDEIIEEISFRDLYNTAEIRRVSGSVDIGNFINETGWLVFDAGLSNTEDEHYVCYDYTSDGTYDKCFSNIESDFQCGISCDFTPFVLEANLNLSYSVINDFGDFNLKLLVDNDNTISNDTESYGIFLDSPQKWYLPLITSTDNDDDVNDDFYIDDRDQTDLREDIPEDKVWFFEWTALGSTYLYEPDFSCWGNSITGSFDVCYKQDGGYNKFCDLNCTELPWYYPYTINSTLPYDPDYEYGVTLILGSIDRNVASYTTEGFTFNPVDQNKLDVIRGILIISVTIFVILVFIVGFIIIGGATIFGLIFGIIFRRFKKRNTNKDNDNK